jgi:putative hemolysin
MLEILIILALILISAIYAGGETGVYCLNRVRLRRLENEGHPRALSLARMVRHRQHFVAMMLGALTLTRFASSAVTTAFFVRLALPAPDLLAAVFLTPLTLLLGEILPKALFARHANTLMYRLVPVMRLSYVVFWPLALLLQGIMRVFAVAFGREEYDAVGLVTTARLSHFLGESRRQGGISAQQGHIAQNIMDLKKVRLGRVMTPLPSIDMIPRDITPEALRERAKATRYSRLPVYEGERANVVGILVLLDYLADNEPSNFAKFIREPIRLLAGLPIDEALLGLRRARQRVAMVTDEQGRAVGIITIKDLVEEIVGDLKEW